MSEKDIKVKPQTTTKAVKNAPKSVEHSAKQAVRDMAKDTLVKNITDKQLNTKHFEQPQRAEVEATEQVENTYIIPPWILCTKKAKTLRKTR